MAADVTGLRLPDFIIAGAPRSATTWLYELADRHPAVAMARPVAPEPKFFLIDERYERGLAYYSSTWFERLPDGLIYGEKSTNYLESATACERIASDLPAARLVFLLRDPVERAHSNYLWSTKNGLENETFERALALEDERERNVPPELRYARPHAYFSRGLYAQMLRPWFARFPRKNILALRSEDVALAPRAIAQALHAFVGVDPRPDLVEGLGTINAARPEGSPPIAERIRHLLSERYLQPNADLAHLLGPSFPGWHSDRAGV